MEIPTWLGVIAVVCLVAITANMLGIYNPSAGAVVGGVVPTTQGAILAYGAGGCPIAGTTDLQAYAEQSIPDPSTGVKLAIPASITYYYAGTTAPFETTVGVSTGYASSTNDPQCATKGIFSVINNATYYSKKVAVPDLPLAPSIQLAPIDMDLISTVVLYGYNTTNPGNLRTATMNDVLAGSGTVGDSKLQIKLTTPRGVMHQPILCAMPYDLGAANLHEFWTANFSSLYLSGGIGKTVSPSDCGTNASYAAWCFQLDTNGDGQWTSADVLKEQASFYVTPVYNSAANFGQINVTWQAFDMGTYVAALPGVLFEGCANPATKADVGAGTAQFVQRFNQV